ncbi:MAG TPA: alpha/beta hydrolase [Candidatus Hydrogenedentes bacterium]|nr:alpha/beta hydrolase [Candidatus Hydrogenedentota bacterium]
MMPGATTEQEKKEAVLAELACYPFKPAWWLPGRHCQTIWGATVRKKLGHFGAPKLRRERWDTPDGDFLDLLFLDGSTTAPVVVLFHGMEGTPQSYYIPGFARHFKRMEWTFSVMFFRSCGFEMNRTATLYHLGATEDPAFVLRNLRERYRGRPLFAIGISLGGNVLAKWLGEQGRDARRWLDAAVIVSPPFDPVAAAPRFHRELFGLYARHFVKTLVPKALDVSRRFPGLLNENEIRKACDFYSFDTAVTAPMAGYRDAEDYWRHTGCGRFLQGVAVPTLLICAADDQFILPECLPHKIAGDSPYLYPLFPKKGGHVGFVSGPAPCLARYWYEEQALRFLKAQLRYGTRDRQSADDMHG